jgi:hypothetical protein
LSSAQLKNPPCRRFFIVWDDGERIERETREKAINSPAAIKGAIAVKQKVPIHIQVMLEANSWAMISDERPILS